MDIEAKEDGQTTFSAQQSEHNAQAKSRSKENKSVKRRRCVSTACIACRRRKSKCDGAQPACAACVSVYNTKCVYDPSSDHRRKGVYKKDIDNLKTKNSTLQTLIEAILNYPEHEVPQLVAKIRACESLDKVADSINAQTTTNPEVDDTPEIYDNLDNRGTSESPTFESRLANKVGELKLDHGAARMLGGTSNLLFLDEDVIYEDNTTHLNNYQTPEDTITSWTSVTSDPRLILHLLNHYFTWHYTFFTILPKESFYRQFFLGKTPAGTPRRNESCTSLLVNAMLALGCHFTSFPGARADPDDSATAGDHFFQEAKRQIYEEDELTTPRLATVQALALMSVREAGCGRESKGWIYSGLSFRMGCDLGLSFQSSTPGPFYTPAHNSTEEDEDAKRITFWGCFMIDKCWSQYLGRLPIFQLSSNVTIPKFEVFPNEDSDIWSPYHDSGFSDVNAQPSRTRTVALQISTLCEISSDLIKDFYHPQKVDKPTSKQQEMRNLNDIHSRLEQWKKKLPAELEPKEGVLPSILIMHMMFQLLYIHLFRPFLKYTESTSPLPSNVSPRRLCTQAASTISKLLRLYKRSHGLQQIVNIAVYICHSACTIHLLNLPDKTAKRDIIHGVKYLEETAERWLCARRTLRVLSAQSRKWNIELPEEAAQVLLRTDTKYGFVSVNPQRTIDAQHSTQLPSIKPNMIPKSDLSESNPAQLSSDSNSVQWDSSIPGSMPSSQSQYAFVMAGPTSSGFPFTTSPNEGAEGSTTSIPSQSTELRTFDTQSLPVESRKRKEADMFGGVEALLREGQDWWMRDQTSVASGFDNWTG